MRTPARHNLIQNVDRRTTIRVASTAALGWRITSPMINTQTCPGLRPDSIIENDATRENPMERAVTASTPDGSGSAGTARILVVDDNADNRRFLASLLGYSGHQVFEACDGEHALDCVRT